jgi:hypothetical protein
MPPGSNERLVPIIVNGKPRMVLSVKARKWLGDAKLDIMAQRRRVTLHNRTIARISVAPSNFDGDAPLKLLFDALEKGKAVSNDRIIRPYFVWDDDTIKDGWLRVELWDSGLEYVPAKGKPDVAGNALVRTFGSGHGVGKSRRMGAIR